MWILSVLSTLLSEVEVSSEVAVDVRVPAATSCLSPAIPFFFLLVDDRVEATPTARNLITIRRNATYATTAAVVYGRNFNHHRYRLWLKNAEVRKNQRIVCELMGLTTRRRISTRSSVRPKRVTQLALDGLAERIGGAQNNWAERFWTKCNACCWSSDRK